VRRPPGVWCPVRSRLRERRSASPGVAWWVVLLASSVASAAAPAGWQLGGRTAERYGAEVDSQVKHGGQASARLFARDPSPDGLGQLAQRLDASEFAGARVRLAGWVRTRGVTGWSALWLRVSGERRVLAFDNMQNRALRGDSEWTRLQIVLEVPKEAVRLAYGLSLQGGGSAWLDDLSLERVEASVPLTPNLLEGPSAPENLDLEREGVEPWFLSGSARADYSLDQVTTPVHGGARALALTPRVSAPRGYGVAMQAFDARPWRGRRVRVAAFLKTSQVSGRGDFWARAQGSDSPDDGPGLSSAWSRLAATQDWTRAELVFDVPEDALELQLGAGIQGPGRLWIDDVKVEAVSRSVPLAPALPRTPVNPNFEER
jgi:hypothetical protein